MPMERGGNFILQRSLFIILYFSFCLAYYYLEPDWTTNWYRVRLLGLVWSDISIAGFYGAGWSDIKSWFLLLLSSQYKSLLTESARSGPILNAMVFNVVHLWLVQESTYSLQGSDPLCKCLQLVLSVFIFKIVLGGLNLCIIFRNKLR